MAVLCKLKGSNESVKQLNKVFKKLHKAMNNNNYKDIVLYHGEALEIMDKFVNPTNLPDERYKEIMNLSLDEARKQLIRQESVEQLIMTPYPAQNNTFPFVKAS